MADSRVSVLIDIRSKLAGLEQASAGFGKLIKGVAGFTAAYLSARSVISGARDIVGLGADLDHMSTRTGIAVSSLSVLRQAFDDNGSSGDRVGKTINDMQKRISEAAQGMGEGKQALDQLGISAETLIALSPEQQFEILSQKIAALENPADRASVAMRIFGESGAELMPLFRSGGALDDARASLGAMPEVLERNSVAFERIDTLLGRMPNKSRQVFAGIGDMLSDELLKPLESINQIDFTRFGQRIGAYIDLAIDAFRDGTLAQFIGLTIEAGFEQGTAAAKRMLDDSLAWLGSGGDGWKVVLNGVMTFGTEAATTLLDALSTPITWLSAGFRKIGDEVRVIFQTASNLLAQAFSAVLNTITAGFENLLNGVIRRVNEITAALPFTDGTQIGQVSFGRVDWGDAVVRPAREFNDLLEEQREGIEEISSLVKGQLNANLEASREVLGLNANEAERELSATERLNDLIEQRIRLREQYSTSDASSGAAITTSGSTRPNDPQSALNAYESLQSRVAEVSADTASLAAAPYEGMFSGLSSGIEGLINGTMRWGDALRSIGSSVVSSLIKSFSDMAAAWIVSHLLMKNTAIGWSALSSTLRTKDTAETIATESAKTPILSTNATLASIGSFGSAAVIGLAAVAAALAAAAAFGAFAEGGYTGTGGKYEPAGIVHRGEYVIPANIVARHGPEAIASFVSSLRVNRPGIPLPGYAMGGLVEPVAASALSNDRLSQSQGSNQEAATAQIFVVPDLASAEDLAADLSGKVEIRIQNAIRRYRT
jgi:hypothetical protein